MVEENEEKDGQESNSIDTDADWFLQRLVRTVERAGVEIGVTLNVGGMLVSGLMIGSKEYFEQVGTDLEGAFSDAFNRAFADDDEVENIQSAAAIGAAVRAHGLAGDTDEANDEVERKLKYIHLKKVSFYHPGGAPMSWRSLLWRGRVAAVDGFFIGNPEKL